MQNGSNLLCTVKEQEEKSKKCVCEREREIEKERESRKEIEATKVLRVSLTDQVSKGDEAAQNSSLTLFSTAHTVVARGKMYVSFVVFSSSLTFLQPFYSFSDETKLTNNCSFVRLPRSFCSHVT